MSVSEHVPSPADAALPTAAEFLDRVREMDGKIYRMREHLVFCITQNDELAAWLLSLKGARPYRPRAASPTWQTPLGAYKRTKESPAEWDIYIHTIPVSGEETIWEAAKTRGPTVDAVDFA